MNKFDVAIIGAGPAGSSAAVALARRGYTVALLDKEYFPREKLCGDFINPSNWPLLEALGVKRELLAHDHEAVTAFRITSFNGAEAEVALPSSDGAAVYGLGLRRFFLIGFCSNKRSRRVQRACRVAGSNNCIVTQKDGALSSTAASVSSSWERDCWWARTDGIRGWRDSSA
jgi:hypothetical protein